MQKRILVFLVQALERNMIRTAVLECIVREMVGQKEWEKQAETARYIAQEILTKDVSSPLTLLKAVVESLPDDR